MSITHNEKAVAGGLATALITVIVQLQNSGPFTLHDFLVALGAYIVTHVSVWLTTNTPKAPAPPAPPVA
jgi:hypothetical protein